MSTVKQAQASWDGNLNDGRGEIDIGDGAPKVFGAATRFNENADATDPERLLAGAQAGCYSMSLASHLAEEGFTPSHIDVTARVHLETAGEQPFIPTVDVVAHAHVDNLDQARFDAISRSALEHCPVARLFAGAEVRLEAHYVST